MFFHNNFCVVVVSNGKILKDNGGEIRIPFGSEYQIKLKNLDSRKAVAQVLVDGKDATKYGKLIVDGNSSVVLDGFMGPNNDVLGKFRFIHKTEEIKNYRGDKIDDGIIVVQYQFERQEIPFPKVVEQPKYVPSKPWNPWYPKNPYRSYEPLWCDRTVGSNIKLCASLSNEKSDEGITVVGSKSDQKFIEGYTKTLENNVYTISLKLTGYTKTNKGYKTITKPVIYERKICPTCGRRSKGNAEFCYNRGTRLLS